MGAEAAPVASLVTLISENDAFSAIRFCEARNEAVSRWSKDPKEAKNSQTLTDAVEVTSMALQAKSKRWSRMRIRPRRNQSLAVFNVKRYGASGSGTEDDASAINNAITAANEVGGGIVFFPAGTLYDLS
jgi:polygalacturonase